MAGSAECAMCVRTICIVQPRRAETCMPEHKLTMLFAKGIVVCSEMSHRVSVELECCVFAMHETSSALLLFGTNHAPHCGLN